MGAYNPYTKQFMPHGKLSGPDLNQALADVLARVPAAVSTGGALDLSALGAATLKSSLLLAVWDPLTLAPMRTTIRDLAMFLKTPQATLQPYGHAPNPMPTTKMDVLYVGANKQFGEIRDAINWANDNATIYVDDGIYYAPAHSSVHNLTIQSVSGNPYRCYMDGEGGNGGGKELSYHKGMLHLGDVTTIIGVGFRHCGSVLSAQDQYSSEAGVYAEAWPVAGTLTLRRCSFDGNGVGVFVPHASDHTPSANIAYEEYECLFAYIQTNSLSNPADKGPSHDRYIGPTSCLIDGSYMYGNINGHSIKSGAPTTIIRNCPWIASWGGRAIETSYGGTAQVTNCTIVSRGDNLPSGSPATGNFIGVGDEFSIFATGNSHTYTDCTFHVGRGADNGGVILMPNGGTLTAQGNTVVKFHQYLSDPYTRGYLHLNGSGTITGLPMEYRPTDADITPVPVPPTPPSWAFV